MPNAVWESIVNIGPLTMGNPRHSAGGEQLVQTAMIAKEGFAVNPMTWDLLQQVFTAETLMTPQQKLVTLPRTTDTAVLSSLAEESRFDVIPLTENGQIVAIWRPETKEAEPLLDQWLVSRDTSIPELLGLLVQSGRPGFLVFHRQEVIGLVTPADLNKVPARVYFYNLVGELELRLVSHVERFFIGERDHLLSLLGRDRREAIEASLDDLIEGNADVNILQMLYLSDLINIVVRHEALWMPLDFTSKTQAKAAFSGLNHLRNSTVHIVRPLVEKVPDDLRRLQRRVDRASDLLRTLETLARSDLDTSG